MCPVSVQRFNMVESQVRPNDVTDRRILAAMSEIPRDLFVPQSLRSLSYIDEHIRISAPDGDGERWLLAPMVLAKLIQLAAIDDGDVVLDIGCGTGYSTAVLARLGSAVVGVENSEDLASKATKMLEDLEISNAAVVTGALEAGMASEGPFDVIVINGGVDLIPDGLTDQLKDGGRLVAVHIRGAASVAVRTLRAGTTLTDSDMFNLSAPALSAFQAKPEFIF